jgi:hypothetical protein
MAGSEEHRNKWALSLAVVFSLFIFVGFAFYRGYININFGNNQRSTKNVASVVSAESAPSPLQNTKTTFKNAFDKIGEQYQQIKNSMANVLVPFVTGIEVYERK